MKQWTVNCSWLNIAITHEEDFSGIIFDMNEVHISMFIFKRLFFSFNQCSSVCGKWNCLASLDLKSKQSLNEWLAISETKTVPKETGKKTESKSIE